MNGEDQKPASKQICTIRILFPSDSDDKALECKKKISTALAGVENLVIDFSLRTMPSSAKLPSP